MEGPVSDFVNKIQHCLDIAQNFDDIRRETLSDFWNKIADEFDKIFKRNYQAKIVPDPAYLDVEPNHVCIEKTKEDAEYDKGLVSSSPEKQKPSTGTLCTNKKSPEKGSLKKEPGAKKKNANKRKRETAINDGNLFDPEKDLSVPGVTEKHIPARRSSRKFKPSKFYSADFVTTVNSVITESDDTAVINEGIEDDEEAPNVDSAQDKTPMISKLPATEDKIMFRTVNPNGDKDSTLEQKVSHIVRVQMSRNNRDIEVYVTRDESQGPTNEVATQKENTPEIKTATPQDHVYFCSPDKKHEDVQKVEKQSLDDKSSSDKTAASQQYGNDLDDISNGPNILEEEEACLEDDVGKEDQVQNGPPEDKPEPSKGKRNNSTKTPAVRTRQKKNLTKTKDGRYVCPECKKEIANFSNMKVHLRIHSGEKPYKCNECGKSFTTFTNMRRHERTMHEMEKRWQCDQCLKRFTEKKSLTVHLRTHSGEKPFECEVCHRKFAQRGTLKTHYHCHIGYKGHLCDFCGKSFRQKSQLHTHQLRHGNIRNFKCSICPKAFVSKVELSRHEMSHSGARPFLCSFCAKTFTRHQYLKQHLLLHTATSAFLCKDCGQSFPDQVSQASHICQTTFSAMTTDANEQVPQSETYIVLQDPTALLMPDYEEHSSESATATQVIQLPTMVVEETAENHPVADETRTSVLDMNKLVALQNSGIDSVSTTVASNTIHIADSQIVNISHSGVGMKHPQLVKIAHSAAVGTEQNIVINSQHQDGISSGCVPIHVEELNCQEEGIENMALGEQYIVIQSQADLTTHEEQVNALSPVTEVCVITENQTLP